ncbi:uncharacterized protein LOC119095851 [Pollicipes pollicipes]|uniref:uncharacterized protein LOC119095851 n=1 Tax=Pollicipes pollicipes TaxID=41117 RepID=UPI0018858FA1|nr:uncharacterized protein LOC119095851 [Pollicipes pollicipes]
MLRAALLLASLGATSLATFHSGVVSRLGVGYGHGYGFGGGVSAGLLHQLSLGGVLPVDALRPALQLVQHRYAGISQAASAQIIRLAVTRPPALLLRRIRVPAVPALSGRLGYLRSLLTALAPSFSTPVYTGGLVSHLGQLGINVPASALIDPLALTDFRVASSLLAPVSVPAFSSFFTDRVLGFSPHSGYSSVPVIPSADVIVSRLGDIAFNQIHGVFRPVVAATGSLAAGVGSVIAPALSHIGLPSLLRPAVVLGGLADYLRVQHVPVSRFVRQIRTIRAPGIIGLINPISVAPIARRLSFVPATVIGRDILPTLALRYRTLPRILQSNLNFNEILPGYFGSSLVPAGHVLDRGFVSGLLSGFDGFIHSRLKGYRGSLWKRGLCTRGK